VLQNDRPYELRDIDGSPVSKTEAIELIQSRFRVSEEIRQARRHRKSHEGRPQRRGTREAAEAPQSRHTPTSPMPVYSVTTE
jgi:hypothetical protein